jgi:HAD superfamily hydrolase (TIGR01509 family)
MPLRAVFFDFDGLILDTESPEVEVWQEMFREHGLEFPDENWIFAIGRGADQIEEKPIALLQRLLGRPVDVASVGAEYTRRVAARIGAEPIRAGVVELADGLRDAGHTVWVVSSSRHDWVDGHLARLGIADRFARTICREEAARAKPFPDLYLRACEFAGVNPADAVALEDSPNGITAAKAAGLYCVAVPNRMTRVLNLSAADRRVESLSEVTADVLASWV